MKTLHTTFKLNDDNWTIDRANENWSKIECNVVNLVWCAVCMIVIFRSDNCWINYYRHTFQWIFLDNFFFSVHIDAPEICENNNMCLQKKAKRQIKCIDVAIFVQLCKCFPFFFFFGMLFQSIHFFSRKFHSTINSFYENEYYLI